MIKGIGHLAFRVKDMEKSLHFYCEILGFKKLFEMTKPADDSPMLIYLKIREGQFLELFYGVVQAVESKGNHIGFTHLCLEVENLHQVADHLRSHGIPLTIEPKQGRDLNWQCWAKDPDGNRIEFMQMDPDSPQMKS